MLTADLVPGAGADHTLRRGLVSSSRTAGYENGMANIAVTPEQLQSVGSQLNAGAANIESTLSQLASQVAPLQSEWQGVAQARFQELWAEWQRSSRGIQEALNGIAQLTQQAGANYESTEQQIAGSFGR
jgi:early secretory antigenic target protein ESAT-6